MFRVDEVGVVFAWIAMIAFVCAGFFSFRYMKGEKNSSVVKQEVYSNFTEYISKGYVESITVYDNDEVEAFIYKDSAKHVFSVKPIPANAKPMVILNLGSRDNFEEFLFEQKANGNFRGELRYDKRPDYLGGLFWNLFPLIVIVGIWIFIMRRMSGGGAQGGVFNDGKSQAKLFDKDNPPAITFKDVAGLKEEKEEPKKPSISERIHSITH